jgi:hypothetical protein
MPKFVMLPLCKVMPMITFMPMHTCQSVHGTQCLHMRVQVNQRYMCMESSQGPNVVKFMLMSMSIWTWTSACMFMPTCECVHGIQCQSCHSRLDTLLNNHDVQVLWVCGCVCGGGGG